MENVTTLTFKEPAAAPHGLYAVVQDASTGFAWNGTTTVDFDSGDWTTFAKPLTPLSGGLWTISVPWASLTAGKTYLFLIFRQAGVTASRSDANIRSVWKSQWGSEAPWSALQTVNSPTVGQTVGADGVARWQVVVPPAFRPVMAGTAREWLNLGWDEGSDAFFNMMIDAAARYAEESMNVAICPQTIAAVFDDGEPITLPRGPLVGIIAVNDANGAASSDYTLSHAGRLTTVNLTRGLTAPVTVVYRAGFVGPSPTFTESPDAIPADIALAILTHVGTLYEARESTTDAPRTAVPHSLDAFYARRNRSRGIG